MDNQKQQSILKRLKVIIVILSVLLVLSAAVLAARVIYTRFFLPAQATVIVPDNIIGEQPLLTSPSTPNVSEPADSLDTTHTDVDNSAGSSDTAQTDNKKAEVIELYKTKADDNERFEVKNIFPGDLYTKYFCVKVNHNKDVDLFFKADITEQTKNLANVLHVQVTRMDTDTVIFDAPFSEINGKAFSELLKANAENSTVAYYKIDVSLDESVGNEYQAARLIADFEWYVENEDGLLPPNTGFETTVLPWCIAAIISLLLILILWKRRKETADEQ